MLNFKLKLSGLILAILISTTFAAPSIAQNSFRFTIGTGKATDPTYAFGAAIVRLLSIKERKGLINFSVSVQTTSAPVSNINSVRSRTLDFGIVQSDIRSQAYKGTDQFANKGPYLKMRSLFSLPSNQAIIADQSVPKNIVYEIVKAVFENIETVKRMHPSLRSLTKQNMLQGLYAPLHSGAMKYYKEAGLK